ncbi:MAG TPA: hypothetical protein VJ023_16845 [Pyrinomonadaceae bacterium]|nr:hypothetical protein [Pyrinomonadaceae bacterium]
MPVTLMIVGIIALLWSAGQRSDSLVYKHSAPLEPSVLWLAVDGPGGETSVRPDDARERSVS